MQSYRASSADYQHDFHVALSATALKKRLGNYRLTVEDICAGEFEIDLSNTRALSALEVSTELVTACQELLQELIEWPNQPLWPVFVAKTNHFLNIWIKAYQAGLEFNIGLTLSSVIKFKPDNGVSNSESFQLYLMGLIAEATNNFNQFRLDYIQNHDLHSGLPNARLMRRHLQSTIKKAENLGYQSLGLMIVSFKISSSIAESYHTANPELISEIAKIIQKNQPDQYNLYQLDIAEFAIVRENLNDSVALELLAAKLQRAFELTIHINNKPCALVPTIAYVYKNTLGTSADEIYLQARRTLDDALQIGKHVAIYTPDLDVRALEYTELERSILEAFENGRFELYLQPIVDFPEKLCTYAELLLRCKNENGDFIPPPTIIEVLYNQGFGGNFLRWLLSTSCRMGAEINRAIGYPVQLSINLAADDLIDTELPHLLSQSLELWGLEAKYITLEITENGLLLDEELANKTIIQLVNIGCTIALDDFGTGYSSMTRLRSMPIDLVKIDQSFVRDIYKSDKDFEIVRAIILLAHSLGKTVVAEGVEDAESLSVLKELFCKKIQGYYFSRPLTYKKFIEWIQEFQTNVH